MPHPSAEERLRALHDVGILDTPLGVLRDEAIAAAVRATSGTVTAQELVDRMVAFSADHTPDDHTPDDDVSVVIVRREPA